MVFNFRQHSTAWGSTGVLLCVAGKAVDWFFSDTINDPDAWACIQYNNLASLYCTNSSCSISDYNSDYNVAPPSVSFNHMQMIYNFQTIKARFSVVARWLQSPHAHSPLQIVANVWSFLHVWLHLIMRRVSCACRGWVGKKEHFCEIWTLGFKMAR